MVTQNVNYIVMIIPRSKAIHKSYLYFSRMVKELDSQLSLGMSAERRKTGSPPYTLRFQLYIAQKDPTNITETLFYTKIFCSTDSSGPIKEKKSAFGAISRFWPEASHFFTVLVKNLNLDHLKFKNIHFEEHKSIFRTMLIQEPSFICNIG